MRFVIAIAAFVLAAIMIGAGIAQRTIWAPAADVTASAQVTSDAPYIVISGATLNSNAGQQTLAVSGSASPFVAYGRTADVKAWIGDEPYTRLTYDTATQSLKSTLHKPGDDDGTGATSTPAPSSTPSSTPTAAADAAATAEKTAEGASADAGLAAEAASISPTAPNPEGSDLWLEEFTGKKAQTTTMNVPDGVSVIIASDGAHAAPSDVSLTWPMDTRTPWAGPLIVLGGLLAIGGIVFYILAIRHMRRGRGPRRGGSNGRGPRLSRAERRELAGTAAGTGPAEVRGRRALGRSLVAVPVVLVGALSLSACSSDYWPSFGESATPTPTATPIATQLPGEGKDRPAPAVTEPQLRNIVARIAATAKSADDERNADLAATRFTGAALTEREVNYKIRSKVAKYRYPTTIPIGAKLYPILPQATDSWPRIVNVIAQGGTAKAASYVDMTLVQDSPRDDYKVAYLVTMLGGAKIPDLAPASIGTTVVPPDSKLLSVQPSKVADRYADVLKLGSKSADYALFDEQNDNLATGTDGAGAEAEAKAQADIKTGDQLLSLEFQDSAGADVPIALATNDAGALVSTSVTQKQIYKLTNPAAGFKPLPPDSAANAFLDVTKLTTGTETDYSYQLLFYVPPVESGEQIRLLGWAQAVTDVKGLK